MVSGLTPFGLSAAHSAYRVGARMLFSSIPGVALAYGSLYPGLSAAALRAQEFGSLSLAGSHSFPANRRFAEFQSPVAKGRNSIGRGKASRRRAQPLQGVKKIRSPGNPRRQIPPLGVSPEGDCAVASGLTPFGTSAAHSACRVGACFVFLLLAGAALTLFA